MNEIFLKGNNNQLEETKKLEYNDLVERFLNYIDVSENTIQTYKYSLKQWALYLYENNINIPTRQDVLNYKELLMKKHSANTTNLYLVSLKNFYKWLEYEEITKDITKNIKSISVEKCFNKRGLTQEEIKRLLLNCKDLKEEVFITLAITCALRSNELSNIRLKDFYNDNGVVLLKVLGKARNGLKQDSVKIDNRLYEKIKEYCSKYNIEDYLFTSRSNHNTGGKVNNITLRRWFNDICKRANIDMDKVSLHSCRHSGISLLVENGEDLYKVQQFSRHKNIQTILTYVNEINLRNNNMTTYLGDVVYDN